jgi:hypothetical protein
MLLPSHTLSFKEARAKGYEPLTVSYDLPGERPMLDAVQRDLDANKREYALVGPASSPQVWTKAVRKWSHEDVVVGKEAA